MSKLPWTSMLIATVLALMAPAGVAHSVEGSEPGRGAKVASKRQPSSHRADPPPRLALPPAYDELGFADSDEWHGPPEAFDQSWDGRRNPPRGGARQVYYQQASPGLRDPGIEPDVGNIPVPGAEEGGPVTERARRYMEHALMYDDAAQAEARERTVTRFHAGYPTNNNNEFGDYAFGPPINGPLLDEAGFYGYGPDHDQCFGSGRCGRDALCCGRGGCGGFAGAGCGRGGCGGCGPVGGRGNCGGCGHVECGSCRGVRASWWEHFTVSGGVQGFKSPIDLGRNGNFGLREGINWGAPLLEDRGIGAQLGLNLLQSDLSGDNVAGPSGSARSQIFVTAGLFRRALPAERWQGGVVYDFLHDSYYVTNDIHKIRGELSYVAFNRDEVGVWVSVDVGSNTSFNKATTVDPGVSWTSNDLYAAFVRRTFRNGSVGRAWAGASGSGDGMLGGEMRIPFADHWALEANVNYLIPRHGSDAYGYGTEEAWNVAIGITWYPGGNAYCAAFNPWRPLFGVADNAIFPYVRK